MKSLPMVELWPFAVRVHQTRLCARNAACQDVQLCGSGRRETARTCRRVGVALERGWCGEHMRGLVAVDGSRMLTPTRGETFHACGCGDRPGWAGLGGAA